MGGVYPYSLFHDILRGREREGEGERKGKGKGKGKGERERERGKNRLRICDYGIFFLPFLYKT